MSLLLRAQHLGSFNSRTPGGVRRATRLALAVLSRFNSRTPGGVRQQDRDMAKKEEKFQFTHPGRGATTMHKRLRYSS